MRASIMLVCAVLFLGVKANACSGCGGAMGINLSDLLGLSNRSTLSLGWSSASYQGNHGSDRLSDQYYSGRISARINTAQNWTFSLALPYWHKTRTVSEEKRSLSGVGDLFVSATYRMNNKLWSNQALQWHLGAGLLLPTGAYKENLHDSGLPQSYNVGTGALGAAAISNMMFSWQNYNVQWSNLFLYLTDSKDDYQLGDQWKSKLILSRQISLSSMDLTFATGAMFEFVSQEHYANDRPVADSGSKALLIPVSLSLAYKQTALQIGLDAPIYQNIINNELELQPRWNAQLTYLIFK